MACWTRHSCRLISVAALMGLVCASPGADTNRSEQDLILTIAQAGDFLKSPIRHVVDVQLTGTVLGVDSVHGGLALQDDSGAIWLRVKVPENLQAGVLAT